jgi:hypothetical protein
MRKQGVGKTVLLAALLLVAVPFVMAAVEGPSSLIDMIGDVFRMISQLFRMDWAMNDPSILLGFFRFLFWITIFTILFSAGSRVAILNRRTAGVIAAVIATASTILTPASVLFGVFETYTVIVLLIMVGIPIGGLMYLAYGVLPSIITNPRTLSLTRLFILIVAWYLASMVTTWGDQLEGVVAVARSYAPQAQTAMLLALFSVKKKTLNNYRGVDQ